MSAQDLELRLRQERAIWRSAQLRGELIVQSEVLVVPFAQADRVKDGLVWLRRHPVYLAALVAVAVAIKPRNALAKLGRAWTVWRTLERYWR
jgi:hypothetical protein